MAEVEIVKMPTIKMSGTVARSNPAPAAAPTTQTTQKLSAPAAPAAPTVPAKPLAAAPPVPPPVQPSTPTVKPPFESKSKKEFFDKLKARSGPQANTPEPPKTDETTPATAKPGSEETPETTPGEDEEAEQNSPETPEKPGETPTTPEAKTAKAKVNPWKLVDEWKSKAATLEKDLLETKKLIPDEVGRKTEVERLTRAEQRAKELEEEIRYVNYAKSEEFKEKFDQPYQDAFKLAMGDLAEISIQTESGEPRPATPQDLLEIVNLPLGKAKERATELFGEFAEEAMAHRKDVRRLWENRVKALDAARKVAVEREQQMVEQHQAMAAEMQKFIMENWQKANEAVKTDPDHAEFFKEVEGDEERNGILAKGYEFADQALQGNPMDPRLKPEDRATIIKRHAALRNRAAAYGTLKHLLAKERAEKAAIMEKLKQYEASTPTTDGTPKTTTNGTPSRATDQVFGKLRALARH